MFVSNGGNLVSYLADLVNSIPNIPSLASLAHDALYYLVNDENVNGASADETDHHLVAKATATIPVEEKPSKTSCRTLSAVRRRSRPPVLPAARCRSLRLHSLPHRR